MGRTLTPERQKLRLNISTKRVAKYLTEMENFALILRYSINGNSYLFAPNFEKHQTGLRKNRESQSKIPPPPPELVRSADGISPPQVKVKDKDKEYIEDIDNNSSKFKKGKYGHMVCQTAEDVAKVKVERERRKARQ